MTIDKLLSEFENNKSISKESIDFIQNDIEIGKSLVEHFKENKNRALALRLLEQLTEIRNLPYPDGYSMSNETLMLSAYILGLHQNVEDSLKIWEAKTIDFDTLCGIDIQLVVFAGLDNTITYLNSQKSKESEDALKYIEECNASGDFEDLEDYFSEKQLPWFV